MEREQCHLMLEQIDQYSVYLMEQEWSHATIQQYTKTYLSGNKG